jgi:hypothetical protein
MNRRHFFAGSAAAVGGLLSTFEAAAQTAPMLAANGTTTLLDPPTSPNVTMCQDVIFDGQRILTLWRSGPPRSQTNFIANTEYFVTANALAGPRLWSWSLGKGTRYVGLGTQGPGIVLLTLAGAMELDPSTGAQAPLVSSGAPGGLRYAGDSTFFRVVGGLGEVWSLQSSFQQQLAGISTPVLSGKAVLTEYCPGGTTIAAARDGSSAAAISLWNGVVREVAISSQLVASSTAFYSKVLSKYYNARPDPSFGATTSILMGIGGDAGGNIYAVVQTPNPQITGMAVLRLDQSGIASNIGNAPLPAGASVRSFGVMKLIPTAGSLGIVSSGGLVAWYTLPTA